MPRLSAAPLALALATLACGGEDTEVVLDLAATLPLAEVHAETRVVDFGTAAARERLRAGWSWDETAADGTTYAWGVGSASVLDFFAAAPRDLDVTLRGFAFTFPGAPRQRVAVVLNGREITTLALTPAPAAHSLRLPAAAVRAGVNVIELRPAYSRSPADAGISRDQRPLSAAWDVLRFEGMAEPAAPRADGEKLFVPFGVEAAYYTETSGSGRFAARDVSIRGRGRLELAWQVDGEDPRLLALEGAGAALPDAAGRPVRLALRAVGEGGGVLLTRPVVRARPRPEPPAAPAPVARPERPPNVLVYLVDTLRADHVGTYGQERPLTPHVDRLAAEGVVFERTLAQTSWTKPAVASVLTGLRPVSHGVNRAEDALPGAARTLAERLAEAGYRTAAFVANGHLTAGSGFAQGFDHFDFSYDLAHELTDRALAWLAGGDPEQPFFVYVHTIDVHATYEPLEPFRSRFAAGVDDPYLGTFEHIRALGDKEAPATPAVVDALLRLYGAEVAQNDAAFGALREGLRRLGRDDGTVIAFLSDHGEAFHEHGVFGHGWDLYQPVLEVPFVLRLPGGPRGARVREIAQHVDLVPTLLDALGLPVPAGVEGRSLLPLLRGADAGRPPPVFSYMDNEKRRGVSVVWGEWKLIEPLGARFATSRELYRPWRDRGERHDLGDRRPVTAGYLAWLARGEVRRLGQGLPAAASVVDEEAREALQALGYAD